MASRHGVRWTVGNVWLYQYSPCTIIHHKDYMWHCFCIHVIPKPAYFPDWQCYCTIDLHKFPFEGAPCMCWSVTIPISLQVDKVALRSVQSSFNFIRRYWAMLVFNTYVKYAGSICQRLASLDEIIGTLNASLVFELVMGNVSHIQLAKTMTGWISNIVVS